ncbi:MAG: Elongation factor G [Tenericutes bacterium ADurb.Bin024]|jgi:elongation factor G|nr:elongation factor G [Erysipelotrichaceae bacterium]OQC50727.1 MAG: Elongation factor G [Tenericutes bacterium ADurb.Bin024]HPK28868.1 elongation factor G [Bacilli bacterium]HPY78760.1 elongation factor G [Bacilli bacterium]HQB96584.1 elongation factor G [Bacilli bacterium]
MSYTTDKIRNIIFLGHQGSGKTTLVEQIASNILKQPAGSVERKNTISDFTPEEKARLTSCSMSVVSLDYNGYRLNLLDAPGNDDFVADVVGVLDFVKAAVLVVDTGKIEVGTVKHFNLLKKYGVPTFIFVNKLDKELVNFDEVLEKITGTLGKKGVSFTYPLNDGKVFNGFVDVTTLKAVKADGSKRVEVELDEATKAKVSEMNNALVEQVALTDDALLEKFFSGEELSAEEIANGLKKAVLSGEIAPVIVGSSTENIGVNTLVDMALTYLPSPAFIKEMKGKDRGNNEVVRAISENGPFSAYVFKTVYDQYKGTTNYAFVVSGSLELGSDVYNAELNSTMRASQMFSLLGAKQNNIQKAIAGDIVAFAKLDGITTGHTLCDKNDVVTFPRANYPTIVYRRAISAKNSRDEEKLVQALYRVAAEDPTLEITRVPETKQLLLGGLSDSHLNFVLDKVKTTFGFEANTDAPQVIYRETVKREASAVGRYVKQSGGSGFYGVVEMRFGPSGSDENVFTEEIFGGTVPKNYHPAVEKGFFESVQEGQLAGFPVIGMKATLFDGKYHSVDSNEQAFRMAAILAYREAYMNCAPTLLEPIMKITISVTNEFTGNVMNDLNQRRARVLSMDESGYGTQEITALVPEAELLDYAIKLRVLSQGSGSFNSEFDSYQEVPTNLLQGVIAANSRLEKDK